MADGMIRSRRQRFCAPFLGLVLTLTGMGPLAQAQTAQEPQVQASAPIEVETFDAASISLRAQFADMVRHSGKVLVFGPEAEANTDDAESERFVLYAPLNRLWLLDAAGEVSEHAWIEVKQEPFDHLVLHWRHWLDVDFSDNLSAAAQMPVFTVESDAPHPLAAQYDALLARPLTQPVDPLPAGAYFSAGGHVFDTTGTTIAEWDSYGVEIALRMIPAGKSSTAPTVESAQQAETDTTNAAPVTDPVAGPAWQWFSVADLAAALNPEQPTEQEEN